ncbi:hypothetical protein ES708_33134 [subsurface metagenome]
MCDVTLGNFSKPELAVENLDMRPQRPVWVVGIVGNFYIRGPIPWQYNWGCWVHIPVPSTKNRRNVYSVIAIAFTKETEFNFSDCA